MGVRRHLTPAGEGREDRSWKLPGWARFALPSALGVGMFLVPIRWDGTVTIGFGVLADLLREALAGVLPLLAAGLFTLSVLLSAWAAALRPAWAERPGWGAVFRVSRGWLAFRALGALFALLTLFQIGPAFLTGPDTGGVLLGELVPVLLTFFFFALLFLPFLVEYGFMEFVGTLVSRPFRWVFRLPGRAAIDATASWMGSGTVGVLITYQQYEKGFYSQREAAVIATNFSVVSVAFCVLVATMLGLGHMFVPFYATVVAAGLIAAVVMPRIPPLSRKPDVYDDRVGRRISEGSPAEGGPFSHAFREAVRRAEHAPGPGEFARRTAVNLADILFGLLPLVMAIGTVALVLVEHTPLFGWLAWPLVPVLELLRIPEAEAAAPAMLVGFADMFLPAVLLAGLESELTRFVIGALSLAQLVYMSEIGAIILKSPIPLGVGELAVIFLLRTVITLPVITVIGHLLYG